MITEDEFLYMWENRDFSMYNETDIREDFIKDLLYILGYSKNTINDIIREKSLNISVPLQRIGRKRIQIDYVPSIRLKSFWILEAKPGNVRHMDTTDMLQAYFYATHPEIQVPYIVLCNGWDLLIYDVNERENWELPIFSIGKENCFEKFKELKSILSAQNMLKFQRKRLLNQIKDIFEVEVDLEQFNEFKRTFFQMENSLVNKIKDNQKELLRNALKKEEEEQQEFLSGMETKQLIEHMDVIGNHSRMYSSEFKRRLVAANHQDRGKMLGLVMRNYRSHRHSIFKVNSLFIFLYVMEMNLEFDKNCYVNNAKEALEEIITNNVAYYKIDDNMNALIHLENICCKFSAICIKNGLMDVLYEKVKKFEKQMSVEEKIIRKPTVAREIIPIINLCAESIWRLSYNRNLFDSIWELIWNIEFLIDEFMKTGEIKKYPDGDSDLLWYESYCDSYDLLFSATILTLSERNKVLDSLELDNNIVELVKMERQEYLKKIPQIKQRPENFQLNENIVMSIFFTIADTLDLIHEIKYSKGLDF